MFPSEIWIVASILVLFLSISLLSYSSGTTILAAGVTFIVIGLVLGVPIGLYYHLLLFHRIRF